jgi:SecD/SecF fusion protein
LANRRSHLLIVGFVLAALAAVGLIALPQSPFYKAPILGLDLQGGLEVILEAKPPPGRPLRESDLKRSETIIRNRIDKLGVSEPEVRRQGEDQISVQLAGVTDVERARELVGKTAQLQFYDLENDLVPPSISANGVPVPQVSLFDLLTPVQSTIQPGGGKQWRVFDRETKKAVAGPFRTKQAAEASAKFEQLGDNASVLGVPTRRIVITCSSETAASGCPPGTTAPGVTYYYLFKYQPLSPTNPIPEMTGDDLQLSGTRADFDPNTGEPIVLMRFTGDGRDKFADVTRELAQRGRRLSFGGQEQFQHFAIVLDNEIRSWPSIDFNENPNGIAGSSGAQITGMAGLDEAKDLSIVLQTGALPVRFVTLQETEISATLGEDSLRQAWQAAVAGLLVVAVFLLIFYRFLGLVAVIGLGIYAVLLYGALLLFDVTLTLPGFAGMILTIGVAADANIVIFERIKEESRAGKSVRAAIASGYGKGFRTIIDANVVTAITALVLFSLASAGVKGFALMLLIGTAISIVTAVLVTRALLGLLAGFKWFDSPAFMGASAREIPAWQRVDIVGRRRIWFTIASVLIALSIGSLVFKGLNLGIDFEGGTEIGFTTPQPVAIEDVRAEAGRLGQEGAVIQGVGAESAGGYREFQIRAETLTPAETRQLEGALEREFQAEPQGARTVSASFSDQILRGAIWAMVISFALITLYITIRFQWRFAVPILRTIVNDGLIALGIYSISGREVSAATVAAFLTIIGYSIYDTIIIFDRVRENLGIMRRATIKEITNVSLWETIPRSLATTFITLLPVSVLFFFGGETLKDFAFAILVGIGISAFSTIFIAAPFLAVLMERVPEYRRRTPTVSEDESEELLEEAEAAAAAEPVPEIPLLAPTGVASGDGAASKRERRRQRRRTRPHGRAR